jgi:hypothetical protein
MEYTITNSKHTLAGKKISRSTTLDVNFTKGELFKMEGDQRQTRITCLEGILWVTQPKDEQDHMLTSGQSTLITEPGLVLIQGIPNGKARIAPPNLS